MNRTDINDKYIIPPEKTERIKKALSLARKLCVKYKEDVVLLLPTKKIYYRNEIERAIGGKQAKELAVSNKVKFYNSSYLKLESQHTFRDDWTTNILVGIYATQRMLEKIDGAKSASAVIIVPLKMEEVHVMKWIKIWNPKIKERRRTTSVVLIKNPVVEDVLRHFTDYQRRQPGGLTHYSGNVEFANIFRILHKYGEPFDPDSVRGWLVRKGWSRNAADQARDFARDLLEGKKD